jgi:hypothetical protein
VRVACEQLYVRCSNEIWTFHVVPNEMRRVASRREQWTYSDKFVRDIFQLGGLEKLFHTTTQIVYKIMTCSTCVQIVLDIISCIRWCQSKYGHYSTATGYPVQRWSNIFFWIHVISVTTLHCDPLDHLSSIVQCILLCSLLSTTFVFDVHASSPSSKSPLVGFDFVCGAIYVMFCTLTHGLCKPHTQYLKLNNRTTSHRHFTCITHYLPI